jgi:putative transposase
MASASGGGTMPFWKCYYHAVWSTDKREPMITPAIEQVIFATIKRKSTELQCPILAINSTVDHIHVAVSIPPKLAAAEWIRHVKGLSTREVNAMFPDLPSSFKWQANYGLLTFGAKQLPFVTAYVERQKEHHATSTLELYLERIDDHE